MDDKAAGASCSVAADGPGPLVGIRVLDLTSTISGPYCTLLLAQLGASVDKIEPPAGDVLRHVTPGRSEGMSPLYLSFNSGKRSVRLDLGEETNRRLLRRSLASFDVIVHNMRPSAASRLGLTARALREVESHAVLCEIVGYGPGPYEDRPAYDDTIQAACGMAWVQGNGVRPEYVRTTIADKTAGMFAAVAICAELAGRARNAPPRVLKIPMLESLAAFTTLEQLGGSTFDPPAGPPLYARTSSPNRHPYATADGHLSVLLYTDRHWASFLTEIGRDDLRSDARFASVPGRTANIDQVYAFVADQMARRGTSEWVEALERIDVPHAPVNSIPDLFDDHHLAAVDMFPLRKHPTEGPVRIARAPFLFDDRPLPQPSFAQRLGAATSDFIAEHGAGTRG